MSESLQEFSLRLQDLTATEIALFTVFFLVVLFIPTFLGLIRNRKHIGKIFLLNIPAALTFTSWFLLMGIVLIKFDNFADLKNRFQRKKVKDEDTASAEAS